jgi:hypothetical protein
MDDVISKLTAAQALKIVERRGKIREAVLTEAMNVLAEIDVEGRPLVGGNRKPPPAGGFLPQLRA